MSTLIDEIKNLASSYFKTYRSIRHHLHANPELSYKEFKTSAFICSELDKLGIPHQRMAETGVIAMLEGRPSERIIALRADIDALPIHEENDVPYVSTVAGVMHACGHDVHTTCLLGAARILHELRDKWDGRIKLIFQPGEERNPGGASLLIREGVLENPRPTHIIGLHVHPLLETGKVSFAPGKVMASADELFFTIRGKGGHAAKPYLTADTILTASTLVVELQQVVSRNNNPFSPSVLSICAIQGGFTTNVIPAEVKLMGTFRAMDETWRKEAHKRIHEIAQGVAVSTGASIDVHIDLGYPSVVNDAKLTSNVQTHAEAYMGQTNVETMELSMGAEDFGYYTQIIPGCFFRLGTGNKEFGITSNVHTPTFDVDERSIETGIGMMAYLGATS
jgi:hippurate hydrolase